MSVRNSRWTKRFGLLSELLEAKPNRWDTLATLLGEISRAFDYSRLDFSWPVGRTPEISGSSDSASAPFSVPNELFAQFQGKSEGVLVDPQNNSIRLTPVRVPQPPVGALLAEQASAWTPDDEALLSHLSTVLGRSPWLLGRLGLEPERRFLIDRLNDGATLAGRLAHDYDNLWTGILGFAELTLPALRPGSHERQYIQEVATIGQRGIQMTAQLHQFSRSGDAKPMPSSVAMVLSKEQARLKQSSNGRIKWSVEVPTSLPSVAIESGCLQIVLGHLLDNAVESMPNGGSIRVSAEAIELKHAEAVQYLCDVRAGSHVSIQISDTGTGIKEDVKGKLFHRPFFSTKPRHRGLGLAIVYRTLSVHRGGLTIESEWGKGTNLKVVLPLTVTPTLVGAVSDRTSNTTYTGGR